MFLILSQLLFEILYSIMRLHGPKKGMMSFFWDRILVWLGPWSLTVGNFVCVEKIPYYIAENWLWLQKCCSLRGTLSQILSLLDGERNNEYQKSLLINVQSLFHLEVGNITLAIYSGFRDLNSQCSGYEFEQ